MHIVFFGKSRRPHISARDKGGFLDVIDVESNYTTPFIATLFLSNLASASKANLAERVSASCRSEASPPV